MTYVTARTVYFCLLIMNNLLNLMYSIDGTYGLDQSAHINRNYIFFLLYRVQPQKPHNETQFFILMIYSKSPFCGLAWRPIGVGGGTFKVQFWLFFDCFRPYLFRFWSRFCVFWTGWKTADRLSNTSNMPSRMSI